MSKLERGSIALIVATAMVGAAMAQAAKKQAEVFRELFLDLDTNKDGAIERDEVPTSGRPAFDRLLKHGDDNRDGKLQAEEYRAILVDLSTFNEQAKKQRADRFQEMDKDKDGKLSREEFDGPKARFDAIDRDRDGSISRQEFVTPGQVKAVGKKKAGKPADPKKVKNDG